MCGIIGYVGEKQAGPILIRGLRRLEYRGYDSAGIAVLTNNCVKCKKSVGNIEKLEKTIGKSIPKGVIGIAHTRWATHGGVSERNAHPHFGLKGKIAIVHNGIIENYREIKRKFLKDHKLKSETDTEILAHLIEKLSSQTKNLKTAVEEALNNVHGTYGLAVVSCDNPEKIIVARKGSPLAIGVGKNEHFIASDATPILPHTRKIIYLDDGEIATITKESCEIFKIGEKVQLDKKVEKIEWTQEEAEKGGYKDFMLKEINEQPETFMDAIRGRLRPKEGTTRMGGFNMSDKEAQKIERITLISCGTAYYACMIGKYLFEKLSGIPTDAEIGSEFRYRNPIVNNKNLVFSVSQSGETLDTLVSQREAKRKGGNVRGIINVVGSTIAREAEGGTYIHAGPELAVASTKAFTNMLTVLTLYAVYFGRIHNMSFNTGSKIIKELEKIPSKMNQILKEAPKIKQMAKKFSKYENMLFLGRGINFPIALEGSHKLKEISYIHSEGYPAGEMKHGANALLDENFPVISITTKNELHEKMVSNMEEVKARKSPQMIIATKGDNSIKEISKNVIFVPKTLEILEPILNILPLQLFAYYVAKDLKRNVDRPRNLAKSVTVE